MDIDKDIQGFWCKKDKTFYYLETGGLSPNNLSKLKSTLIARDLITYYNLENPSDTSPSYKQMTAGFAAEKGYDLVPVYTNRFIQQRLEEKKDVDPKKDHWS